VLIDHLPPESATITAVRASLSDEELEERGAGSDPAKGRWSAAEMLLAAVIDELRSIQYLYVSAHVKQGQAGKPPEPVARPGVTKRDRKARRTRLTDEQRRILDPRLRVVRDGETASLGPDGGLDAWHKHRFRQRLSRP
jgi:hypothetical protein